MKYTKTYMPFKLILSLIFLLHFGACFNSYTPIPKKKAYFKIELPEHSYQSYDNNCPFKFDYPTYAQLEKDTLYFNEYQSNPCWYNLEFEALKATLHISYNTIKTAEDINQRLNDSHDLSWKHTVKAAYIEEESLEDSNKQIYGRLYNIGGNAASSLQFYLTDSSKHFLRAALYFDAKPNIDSMGDVIHHVKKDIEHLIYTFEWRDID